MQRIAWESRGVDGRTAVAAGTAIELGIVKVYRLIERHLSTGRARAI